MAFVKVERDELIKQLKEYIVLLKRCPKGMEFHTSMEFCGIDKQFLDIAGKFLEKKQIERMGELKRAQEKEETGNI